MKLGEFSGISQETVQLKCKGNVPPKQSDWNISDEVALIDEFGDLILLQGSQQIHAIAEQDAALLKTRIEKGLTLWTLTSIRKSQLYLRYVELPDAPTSLDLDIGVDGRIVEELSAKGVINGDALDSAIQWLSEEFILTGEEQPRLFASVYAGNQSGTFEIRGRDWVATIDEQNGLWSLSKLTRTRRTGAGLRILQGHIQFIDISVAGQLNSATQRHALEQAISQHGSYMQLWQQYSDMEWTFSLTDARAIGAINFKDFDKGSKSKQWDFIVDAGHGANFEKKLRELAENGQRSSKDFTFEAMRSPPDWLSNEEEIKNTGLSGANGRPWLCKFVEYKDGFITVEYESDRDQPPPFPEGIICLSMHGNRKVRERRQHAVDHISQRNNPMPQLHYLLEGSNPPFEKPKRLRRISGAVKARFKGEPTRKQQEALKVAYETPDVALIIGPPGTGKTQVISALQALLAEDLKGMPFQHQMLISSFQHDAVDNVMERSNVFGLPAIKVGGRRKKSSEIEDNPITAWCHEKAVLMDSTINALLEDEPVFNYIKLLQKELITLQVSSLDFQQKIEQIKKIEVLLVQLKEQFQIRLSPEVQSRWQQWLESLRQTSSIADRSVNRFLVKRVRGLRCTLDSFIDDGPYQCMRVLAGYEQQQARLDESDRLLLQSFSEKPKPEDVELTALKELKTKLLDQCIPDYRPRHVQQVMDEKTCLLLGDIRNDIQKVVDGTHSLSHLKVLDRHRTALKHSPEVIKQAAGEYTGVLGSTCQQAASEQMTGVKQVDFQTNLSFNTVIVDEAARANPLDLMVPMAMGKRRIVLVGDHRQLPHLLEPKVEDELAEEYELNEVHKEMLKLSLFERMMNNFKEMEKEKNQPKRVVMLDTQFRMHRLLGDFISENFYKKHGGPILSGLEDEQFKHNVRGFEGKVCGWIDVPKTDGKSHRHNGSLKRDIEADVVARKAKEILEQCPNLSVGVITFYSAQVNQILKSMSSIGLTEKVEGELQIKPEWLHIQTEKGEQKERLRVGSVDAFQGKEFDIVLLSMVRTSPNRDINIDDDNELTKAFGFLRLDNRLNVAMSRQHRLLIMVADASLAKHSAAEKAAPSIPAFYQLCEGEHGSIY
ncbi:DEAD/DEAH box helicase [Endozoicomonas ascidiicola]|uniref:DEAD/DEAH box helicase n=1 Tax=Endozoicomonas ascidiicola TaxID=1698521 RepID=UPI00082FA587|nr:AAA domain-containing protein [Endozoicomonas ascidiicola]